MNSLHAKTTKLWNKNFTILVIGSFISMMGYTCASFAMSLLVYDESQQVLFFALTQVASMLPRIVMPMIAGTYFDRHSRARAIYKMDFSYTVIFAIVTVLLYFKSFPYWMFIFVSLIIGSIDGAYMVAFDSIFPLLTTTQTTRKAYSINSMLYPIASFITAPLTLIFYDKIGALAIFAGATVLFAVTASIETLIVVREPHLVRYEPEKQAKLPPSPKELELAEKGIDIVAQQEIKERSHFFTDFKEGVKYIFSEKGLFAITLYFFVISICSGLMSTLMIPYFRSTGGWTLFGEDIPGMYAYLLIFGMSTVGRLIGANVQYRVKFPKEKRYKVAVAVYIITTLIYIVLFHLPMWLMILLMLFEGMLSVTSYNIRISSTQIYVPDNKRGRFNGAFLFFNMLGSILGQLAAGFIGNFDWSLPSVPIIVSITFLVNLAAVFVIIVPAKKYIEPIYNADL